MPLTDPLIIRQAAVPRDAPFQIQISAVIHLFTTVNTENSSTGSTAAFGSWLARILPTKSPALPLLTGEVRT